jgi:hypothetical protein
MGQPSLDKEQIGKKAWLEAREFLDRFGWQLQQIDWLGERNGEWVKFEIKAQEPFVPPPFEGHGLPRWQVTSSMKLLKDKQIRTYLIIKDLKSNKWIGQFIDELEKGIIHDTFGSSPRRIYPIEKFELAGESLVF